MNEFVLELIQISLGVRDSLSHSLKAIEWEQLYDLAQKQGLDGFVVDGMERLEKRQRPPKEVLLQWIGTTLHYFEHRYHIYLKAICSLARFYNEHGFKMMILKGYACSLDWPRPEYRPMGDVDIWLFGKQRIADELLKHETGIEVDDSHHHHTVFEWQGFIVENHYDFINVHHHRSNIELNKELKRLAEDDSNYVMLNGERIFLPSPNFHAFFLLRHVMNHFASEAITLRQLLDWGFFAINHKEEIDWDWLQDTLKQHGLKTLYDIFNVILNDDLGLELVDSKGNKLKVSVDEDLKKRVLRELLSPEFGEEEPLTIIPRAIFKYRRWKVNGWKHQLCYQDSMWSAFWSGVWSHLLKPKSI